MGIPHVDVKAQYAPLIPQLKQRFEEVLESGAFILGPNVKAFEQECKDFLGTADAIGVANGTDALALPLMAWGVGRGDVVSFQLPNWWEFTVLHLACLKLGASRAINYKTEDFVAAVKEATGGKGVDIIFDPVGGTYAEAALRSIAWEGRFLVIGFAAGDIPKMPLNLALLKGCDIRGVFWGAWTRLNPEKNRANLEKLVQWAAEGKISSHVDRTFPLAQTADALKVLAGRQAMGKVILHP